VTSFLFLYKPSRAALSLPLQTPQSTCQERSTRRFNPVSLPSLFLFDVSPGTTIRHRPYFRSEASRTSKPLNREPSGEFLRWPQSPLKTLSRRLDMPADSSKRASFPPFRTVASKRGPTGPSALPENGLSILVLLQSCFLFFRTRHLCMNGQRHTTRPVKLHLSWQIAE